VLSVIAVLITNDVSKEDLAVTEIIKIVLPNSLIREGMEAAARTDSPSKEGWVTVTTKRGRQSILPGRYDPATGKTVSWNVTASKVNVETGTIALLVKETGYYDMFNVVDLNEAALLAMHHMQNLEFANIGAGIGGGFKNTKELKVMNYNKAVMDLMVCVGKQKLKMSINECSQTRCSKFNVVDLNEASLLAMHHMQNSEFANIGAGIGGGFKNTKELKVMNYNKAVNGPDGVRWKAEVENEYQ